MTPEEYAALVEAGILHKVELVAGRVMMGRYPLAFSQAQVRDAAQLGIELVQPTDRPTTEVKPAT